VSNKLNGYNLPSYVVIFRWIFRPIFRMIFHLISEVRITGIGNIPENGSYIIAINHISIVEPPFVIAFWPVAPEAVGAKDIWERRGQSLLAKFYGGIQVHRGEFDRRLIERMLEVIEAGYPILIAPEGGRSHSPGLRPAFPGVAYIIDKSGVPVLPVGIIGSTDDFLHQAFRFNRPLLEMRIGKPTKLPVIEGKGEQRRLALKKNADLIMYKVAELLPPSYQGVYASGRNSLSETSE
jgi:1-acyl-sn-glycerol-3-phosphate acyltransferase